MNIGIVGHEEKKFTSESKEVAKNLIYDLLQFGRNPDISLISGGCHLGGIDIWAEEIADSFTPKIHKIIFKPSKLAWGAPGGFKERNRAIAGSSDIVHCIVVEKLPEGYDGMRFTGCYHCHTGDHVKSGGCWTALKARKGMLHIVCQSADGLWYVKSRDIAPFTPSPDFPTGYD